MGEPDYPETQPDGQEKIPEGYFSEELTAETEDTAHQTIKIESMTAMVLRMDVSDKIKLAIVGNKEARGLLIKESNKVVVKNVLENPRVTDEEIVFYAGNKNLSGEVAR
ncbi:MAG: hypothetical protein FJ119_14695, partial [Deltaproteobacteria bacterium]|nr:hypothetical protein [Deltaproteobacteria bacterium]